MWTWSFKSGHLKEINSFKKKGNFKRSCTLESDQGFISPASKKPTNMIGQRNYFSALHDINWGDFRRPYLLSFHFRRHRRCTSPHRSLAAAVTIDRFLSESH